MYHNSHDSSYASDDREQRPFLGRLGLYQDNSDLGPSSNPLHWRLRGTDGTFEIRPRHIDIFKPRPDLHEAHCGCDNALSHHVSDPYLTRGDLPYGDFRGWSQPRPYPDLFKTVRAPRGRDDAGDGILSPAISVQLDSEDHKSRVPARLPALSKRIESASESDSSSSSTASGRMRFSGPARRSGNTWPEVRRERRELEGRVARLRKRERVLKRMEKEEARERLR